ncbi:hypothetical protein SDC9_157373 [bioreactor metagenome]|uniref:Uncharacterized protein n=1 Tax=bioreactor metagenome TaxID=1076179 RepID=A0A645F852_9ZZZZ
MIKILHAFLRPAKSLGNFGGIMRNALGMTAGHRVARIECIADGEYGLQLEALCPRALVQHCALQIFFALPFGTQELRDILAADVKCHTLFVDQFNIEGFDHPARQLL